MAVTVPTLRTQYAFTLPRGYVDASGAVHRARRIEVAARQRERVLRAQRCLSNRRHHMRSRPSWQMWTSSRATSFPDAFSAEPVYFTGQPWSNFQVAIVFPV